MGRPSHPMTPGRHHPAARAYPARRPAKVAACARRRQWRDWRWRPPCLAAGAARGRRQPPHRRNAAASPVHCPGCTGPRPCRCRRTPFRRPDSRPGDRLSRPLQGAHAWPGRCAATSRCPRHARATPPEATAHPPAPAPHRDGTTAMRAPSAGSAASSLHRAMPCRRPVWSTCPPPPVRAMRRRARRDRCCRSWPLRNFRRRPWPTRAAMTRPAPHGLSCRRYCDRPHRSRCRSRARTRRSLSRAHPRPPWMRRRSRDR